VNKTAAATTRRLRARLDRFAWTGPIAVAGVGAAVVWHVAGSDPNQAGNYPTCPFLYATGLQCPGCGTLRMIHALAHGDLAGAASMNLLSLAVVPFLLYRFGRWTATRWGLLPPPRTLAHPAWIWSFTVLVALFWVARNLPPTDFLAPGG
jgi:hypothetical protein